MHPTLAKWVMLIFSICGMIITYITEPQHLTIDGFACIMVFLFTTIFSGMLLCYDNVVEFDNSDLLDN